MRNSSDCHVCLWNVKSAVAKKKTNVKSIKWEGEQEETSKFYVCKFMCAYMCDDGETAPGFFISFFFYTSF